MTQKIFLTSALAMGVMAPAMAEPSNTGTFPNDGYMQEDYTYTNAATADNMDSVYEGTVNAVAEYDIIDYIVNAGQYLPADSETVITCPAGSFCPGIDGNVQYNQTTPQGIQTCPTGYASSAAGASSDTQCYRTCDINNMGTSFTNIAHATAVSGNDYYGNGADTCEPTACVNGWHVKAATPDLMAIMGMSRRVSEASVNNNGSFSEDSATYGASFYGFNNGDTKRWGVYYGADKGMVTGEARCSGYPGSLGKQVNGVFPNATIVNSFADETGPYCYCRITGYKIGSDGAIQSVISPWVYKDNVLQYENEEGATQYCESACEWQCRDYMQRTDELAFRATMFGTIEPGSASCEANTITINWSDASAADISANNAGTATYGEDVRTPVKAATKKGQTFRGWRFSKPTETNLP